MEPPVESFEPLKEDYSSPFTFTSALNFAPIDDFSSSQPKPISSKSSYMTETAILRSQKSSLIKLAETAAVAATYGFVALTFPISLPLYYKNLSNDEVAIVSRVGGELCIKEGKFLTLPLLDTFEKFSKVPVQFKIEEKGVLTKDKFELTVLGTAFYKIDDPLKFVREVSNESRKDGDEHDDQGKQFIERFFVTTMKKIIGQSNYCNLKDEIGLRNEILMDCNYTLSSTWGITILTDRYDVEYLLTKRGEDGPGDPMVQIVTLIKEHFDLTGEKKASGSKLSGGLGGFQDLANSLKNPMPMVLPGFDLDPSKLSETDLTKVMQMMAEGSNIMNLHKNSGGASSSATKEPQKEGPTPSSINLINNPNESEQLLANHKVNFLNFQNVQSEVLASSSLNEQLLTSKNENNLHPEIDLKKLLPLENFTGHKSPKNFQKLNKKLFKITITDFDNPFPGFSKNEKISLFINGKDINRPFLFSINELARHGQLGKVDVSVDLSQSDVGKMLKSEFKALKSFLTGKIKVQGSCDVSELINVAEFIRECVG